MTGNVSNHSLTTSTAILVFNSEPWPSTYSPKNRSHQINPQKPTNSLPSRETSYSMPGRFFKTLTLEEYQSHIGDYSMDAVKNFLELVPMIVAEWVEKEGTIAIYNDRFKTERGKRIGAIFGLKPYFFIRIRKENLYGQFIWRNIDGERTVKEISTKMFAEFSEDETLSYARVKRFMDTLEMNKYIIYGNPGEDATNSPEKSEMENRAAGLGETDNWEEFKEKWLPLAGSKK